MSYQSPCNYTPPAPPDSTGTAIRFTILMVTLGFLCGMVQSMKESVREINTNLTVIQNQLHHKEK